MFDTPTIETLDLRSPHGKLRGAMQATNKFMAAIREALIAQESWIDWDAISWEEFREKDSAGVVYPEFVSWLPPGRLVGRLLDVVANWPGVRSMAWAVNRRQRAFTTWDWQGYSWRITGSSTGETRSYTSATGGGIVRVDYRNEAPPKPVKRDWLAWIDKPLDFSSYIQGMLIGSALTASVISIVGLVTR